MKLFFILTGIGESNYILATSKEDAMRYFKEVHVMDCYEIEVKMSVEAVKYWKQ